MTDQPTPWCCRGWAQGCPLCPDYGTRRIEPCPGHDNTPGNQQTVATAALHARQAHPGWEYATTEGPRKQWDYSDEPPSDDNGVPDPTWQRNIDAGYPGEGWERFDYTEESYWRRPVTELAEPVVLDEQPVCCDCQGAHGPVVYRNYLEQPFCAHCCECSCGAHPCTAPQPEQPARHTVDTITDAALNELYATIRRLNYRAQNAESKLAAYTRAVATWNVNERGTYIPHASLAAIARAAGTDILGSVRHLRYFARVEQAEAAIDRVRAIANQIALDSPWGRTTADRIRAALDNPKESAP